MTLYNLGLVAKAVDDPAAARGHFAHSLAIWEAAYGGEHHLIGHALTGLGQALVALGRPREARAHLERALGLREAPGTDPALLASTRFSLARALAAEDEDPQRAAALAAAAREGYRLAGDAEGESEVRRWLSAKGDPT
jgi:tetratricopeptide (TPR) repeat protein